MLMSSVEYSEDTLLSLIQEKILEHLFLDYKSAKGIDKKENLEKIEFSRDVTSFANSAGGDIIFGIDEKDHLPTKIDGTTDIIEKKTWLEQIINSNIQPRINGIKVYPVLIPSQDNAAVLVVHIPQSHTAHQAKDQKYWCRYGSEKQAMEDYQVRQTMNRMRDPLLQFTMKEIEIDDLHKVTAPNWNVVIMDMHLINTGVISAKSWRFNFHFPREILQMQKGSWQEDDRSSRRIRDTIKWKINELDAQSIVLHPGQRYALSNSHELNRFELALQGEYLDWNKTIPGYYEVYAENMPPKYGKIDFIFNEGTLKVQSNSMDSLPFTN